MFFKRLKTLAICGVVSCALMGMFNAPVNAASTHHTNNLKGVEQVVLVTVPLTSSSQATVKAYEATSEGKWTLKKSSSGRVGANGIAPISTRQQGTKKTPQGIIKLTAAYGKLSNPGTKFTYNKITSDMYWNLNSGSSTYNQLVRKNPGGDYEHLIDYNSYNYMFTTDYNIEQIAGKGGAIFFHCNGKGATAGCISVPQDTMKWYMQWLDPAKNPVIIVTTTNAVQQYFVPSTSINVKAVSKTSAAISWNRVYGTATYYVQRAESQNGSYKTVATINNPATTSWTDKSLTSGKTYYYRVLTRNYIDGSTGYTGYSSVVGINEKPETLVNYKTTTNVNYRSGAGTGYAKKGTLKSGTTVKVVNGWYKTANGYTWYKIKMNGNYYYAASKYLKKVTTGNSANASSSTSKEALVNYKTTTNVNYRSGAGTGYAKKGTLKSGTTVKVVNGWYKTANGYTWYKVKINGNYYYMVSKYLKK